MKVYQFPFSQYFLDGKRFNPSVHRAKGDRLVRARALSVCDNGDRQTKPSNIYNWSKFIYKYFYDCVVVYVYVTLDSIEKQMYNAISYGPFG